MGRLEVVLPGSEETTSCLHDERPESVIQSFHVSRARVSLFVWIFAVSIRFQFCRLYRNQWQPQFRRAGKEEALFTAGVQW